MALGISEFRWYYGAFGVVIIATFFLPARKAYDYATKGRSVDARVTDFAPQKDKLSGGSMITFPFRDDAGQKVSGSDAVYGGWYPPADKVIRVRYLPESPSQTAILEGNSKQLPITLFCIGLGIVLLAGVAEIYVCVKHRRFPRQRPTEESPQPTDE